jgi:3-methyladenine DNA glycosylase AlkC
MAEPLKNIFFTKTTINKFANEIGKAYKTFDKNLFISLVYVKEWEEKELKARMHHITECLHKTLPEGYKKALSILLKIADKITGIEGMCLPDFVEKYGLDYWDISLAALKEFTKYSSSEFAIRPFIMKDKKRAMHYMLELSVSDNEHIRRFSSEGCRPRLPWAMALPELKKDPGLILPILENLKTDDSEYVRKSVANNLNDISKDHPELVLDICEKWSGKSKHTDWIIKRACRTLLKAGNPRAMLLFGYGTPSKLQVTQLAFKYATVHIGDELEFSFVLNSNNKKETKVRLEYAIDYLKANGKHSSKVFMITEKEFSPGKHSIFKKQSFKERTTRKHYPGGHGIKILVNGIEKASAKFELKK